MLIRRQRTVQKKHLHHQHVTAPGQFGFPHAAHSDRLGLFRSDAAKPMAAKRQFHATIFRADIVQKQADEEHILQDFDIGLTMLDTPFA